MTKEAMEKMVEVLKEVLMLLVTQGHITEAQADERARNQAMALLSTFKWTYVEYCEVCDKEIDEADCYSNLSGVWCSRECYEMA